MANYQKIYRKFYNIGDQDVIKCKYCKIEVATEIHHIEFKSQGGEDEIENLIALCRSCHSWAHNSYKRISMVRLNDIVIRELNARKALAKTNS